MSAFINNAPQRVEELKALRQTYKGTDNFKFLGPKVPEATEENPTKMIVTFPDNDPPMDITVTMPSSYPSETAPIFKVEQADFVCGVVLSRAQKAAIKELLDESASYMPGLSCISTTLMSLDDLDMSTLDLGQPGRCRSIFKVDVVNNSKQFANSLKSAAAGYPCHYWYRTIACQNNAKFSFAVDPWRAVYCMQDAPDKKLAVEFLKTVRTDGGFDADMLGKPGKIALTVIEEFEMGAKAETTPEGFGGTEYRTDAELNEFMGPYLAKSAQAD